MPRAKYKSHFTITITKEQIETVPGDIIQKEEYTQEPDIKKEVIRTIYTQTVETMNLKKVIAAVNGET